MCYITVSNRNDLIFKKFNRSNYKPGDVLLVRSFKGIRKQPELTANKYIN